MRTAISADYDLAEVADRYHADGFVSAVPVLSVADAELHRRRLESLESKLGPLHYLDKIHLVSESAFSLASQAKVLDLVEQLIGPNIALYNSTYIIKEAGSTSRVDWHQDLTYWGLSDDDAQVSMWLALSPATGASGCMKMIPGSHRAGRRVHEMTDDETNLLNLKQRVADFDPVGAVDCQLTPGQASFHHGWTVHSSAPNTSSDRRIGLNVQYVAPANHLIDEGADPSAILLSGDDKLGYFRSERPAKFDLDPASMAVWKRAEQQMKDNFRIEQ